MNFVNHIDFVTDQQQFRTFIAVLTNSVQPVVNIREGFNISDIENKNDADCAAIVLESRFSKSVLTSCVPYLNLY